jgi:hypothetical protein
MFKKKRLKSMCYIFMQQWQLFALFVVALFVLFLSPGVFADNLPNSNPASTPNSTSGGGVSSIFGTTNTQNQSSTSGSTSASTSTQTSSDAKDQEDLKKLFERARYEDFDKQKPVGGLSLYSPERSEDMP